MGKLTDFFVRFPTLSSERIVLRKMVVSDSRDMFEYSKDPSVTKYLLWEPHADECVTRGYLRYLQGQYARKSFHDWAIVLRDGGKMIGTCGFARIDEENNAAEVGYVLNPDYWGYGYAAEALSCVIRFGFKHMGLNRISARILDGNERSMRVAEKCGMFREAIHRHAIIVKGEYKTYHEFVILHEDYVER